MPPAPEARRRRADARQNAARILDAAVSCLARDPQATMAEVAAAAGVGRVTVYAHFASRESLVEAALVHLLDRGERVLDQVDLAGEPLAALASLVDAGWLLMAEAGSVLRAAQDVLPHGRVQELHAGPAARVTELVERGQRTGAVRSDLPATWLTSALHHLLKGVADDVARGAVDAADAPRLVVAFATAALQGPAGSCSAH